MGKVSVDMNGVRRNITRAARELKENIECCLNGGRLDSYEIVEKFNDLLSGVNSINCIYMDDVEHFDDMSENFINFLDAEDFECSEIKGA